MSKPVGFEMDDDGGPRDVVDGRADNAEGPDVACERFIRMCTRLRAMGATEVRDHGLRARFPVMSGGVQDTVDQMVTTLAVVIPS